ncbi:RNA polymerase II subunit 5-mediating protein homolog [Selaginella moellendorffii]|uniref:RNA polymerase II subunit 5-mediating protein homolog n=1 Tax=Selaginella moellendorffii TaxID=88036 RepID=UPI000D1CABC4|nr:RNA polymerase II subunit 5-mediating protein homolog [Selaginella moellendorffii]|eukprot:XP_024539320.1 RNA polymerase II subunit 5-mediating protein homolog [Selaginella moellendorffii]
MGRKGTVTPLAELLPVGELAQASDRIQGAIREHADKLQQLQSFADDNRAIHKLVQELPHNVAYNIMVPFGKAAFFPGKLVHTNEMLVLLGEGYYAERSAKQTLELLMRRAKFLDSNIESINSQIADLRAEATFASTAAEEAAAGVVDIREEYDEEIDGPPPTAEQSLETQGKRPLGSGEDLEHERLMARFSELEAEEAAAAAKEYEDEYDQDGFLDDDTLAKMGTPSSEPEGPPAITNPGDLVNFEMWKQKTWNKTSTSTPDRPEKRNHDKKAEKRVTFDLPEADIVDTVHETEGNKAMDPQSRRSSQHEPSKVFGSVIERTPGGAVLDTKVPESTSMPARPVSRFKQRHGG